MVYIEIDKINTDDFMVLDEECNPVTGLIQSDFTIALYNPSKNDVANISGGITVTIEEVGDGLYRINFTPDTLGEWTLIIYHTTYFPWGQGESYRCVTSLGGISQQLEDAIYRILGLSQENYRIFNQAYDKNNNLISGLVKIYPSAADVDADTNAISSYQMTATFNIRNNHLTGYKMKKL